MSPPSPSPSRRQGEGFSALVFTGRGIHRHGPRALMAFIDALNALPEGRARQGVFARSDAEILDAGVVLILRLTFLLFAEAKGLLPLGQAPYDAFALTPLAAALAEGDGGDAGLEAFPQLLRLFELIHRGDADLGLAAHGGRLFGPGTPPLLWIFDEGETLLDRMARRPLPLSDGDISALLEGLRQGDAGPVDFAAMEVEDLGHLYEPLLGLEVSRGDGGALILQASGQRRSQGSHYTPRTLTAPIVAETLGPLLGARPDPEGILALRVCDMSMGSGAFLLEAVRYLADALMAAWDRRRAAAPLFDLSLPYGRPAAPGAERLPGADGRDWAETRGERLLHARRLVAERSIYGVDIDPHAVEMARLSLWLLTFSEGLPFTALDHALAVGDAIFGIGAEELSSGRIGGEGSPIHLLFDPPVGHLIEGAIADREALRSAPLRTPADARRRRAHQRRARNAMALLRLMGDLIVAAYLGPGGKRALKERLEDARIGGFSLVEEWRRLGYPGHRYRGLMARAEATLGGRRPLHWPFAFPDVFLGEGPRGFDAILGNPPFGNAIEAITARPAWARSFFSAAFPEAAKGAYDLANLFMVQAVRCLRPGGRFGLLQPRSNLSQGSARATQDHLQSVAPLRVLIAPEDANLFPGASVYVACAIAERRGAGEIPDPSAETEVRVIIRIGGRARVARLAQGDPWWTLVSGGDRPRLKARGDLRPLGELVEAFAGASTGAAYALRPLVEDSPEGSGPRLITTGLIDRHTLLWGERSARFLKGDFDHPRWPDPEGEIPEGVRRAMARQAGAKVLVGGLSRRVEAVADLDGLCAGVVSTHILRPRPGTTEMAALGALVSSHIFSYHYMRRFGAKRMGDGNWTIGKRELLDTPVPPCLWDRGFTQAVEALLDGAGQPIEADEAALQALFADAYGVPPLELETLARWYEEGGRRR